MNRQMLVSAYAWEDVPKRYLHRCRNRRESDCSVKILIVAS